MLDLVILDFIITISYQECQSNQINFLNKLVEGFRYVDLSPPPPTGAFRFGRCRRTEDFVGDEK